MNDFTYKSPIELMTEQINFDIEQEVYRAVQRVGVSVNKEELIKALKYDRRQYEKGYNQGYFEAKGEIITLKKVYPAENTEDIAKEIGLAILREGAYSCEPYSDKNFTGVSYVIKVCMPKKEGCE